MGIPKFFFPHVMFSPKTPTYYFIVPNNLNVAKSSFLICALLLAFNIDPCGDANEKMRRIGVGVCVCV